MEKNFNDVKGQEHAKRALEVAAAGDFSVLLIGPSGAGKTMLAERISTITAAPYRIIDLVTSDKKQIARDLDAGIPLILTALPCPCGNFTDPARTCNCTPRAIQKHIASMPAYLIDRIDIQCEIPRLRYEVLTANRRGEYSAEVKKRVDACRAMASKPSELGAEASELLKLAISELGISARGYDKIISISGIIAALDSAKTIEAYHISETIQYRVVDRNI